MTRNQQDFTQDLQKAFSFLTINNKYKMIGSSVLKARRYAGDFDINEDIGSDYNQIAKRFKDIFRHGKQDDDVFITDFKCGVDANGRALRWTYGEVMKGKKNGILFIDALRQKELVKLDTIFIIDNKINEITNNYLFRDSLPTSSDIKLSLQNEIREKIKAGEYFKAIKRIFSLNSLFRNKSKDQDKLINYFNSDVGLLNKVRSDIDLLVVLIENKFKPVELELIRKNIQMIKYELSAVIGIHLSAVFDKISLISNKTALVKELMKISGEISELVDDDAKLFLQKLK